MRAAAYVRLSKEDREGARSGIESCLVQEKNAERAIQAQGWTLADRGMFVDDDVSGAEILRRPSLQAMLLAAERRMFEVLVLRDSIDSRAMPLDRPPCSSNWPTMASASGATPTGPSWNWTATATC